MSVTLFVLATENEQMHESINANTSSFSITILAITTSVRLVFLKDDFIIRIGISFRHLKTDLVLFCKNQRKARIVSYYPFLLLSLSN